MSYNKAKEERKWKKWKNAEEKQLRALGVSEDIIKRLHTYDKEQFNKERQYKQKQVEWTQEMDLRFAQTIELSIKDVNSLLNSIDDSHLLCILSKQDAITLQIILYKIMGYTSEEIAGQIALKTNAIDKRICRLKKKL